MLFVSPKRAWATFVSSTPTWLVGRTKRRSFSVPPFFVVWSRICGLWFSDGFSICPLQTPRAQIPKTANPNHQPRGTRQLEVQKQVGLEEPANGPDPPPSAGLQEPTREIDRINIVNKCLTLQQRKANCLLAKNPRASSAQSGQ